MSDDYAYLGTQDPSSNVAGYNALVYVIQQEIQRLNTATLAKVVRAPYDADGNALTPGAAAPVGFIDVQPLVNQLDGYGNPTPHGTVYRVSYHRYASGLGAFMADPRVGDVGKFVVASRDTSVVRTTGDVANPGSRRKYNLADGTWLGITQGATPGQYFTWTETGFRVVDMNGNSIEGNATGVLINGVMIAKTGDVIAHYGTGSSVTLSHHTHPDPQGGNTGAPNAGT